MKHKVAGEEVLAKDRISTRNYYYAIAILGLVGAIILSFVLIFFDTPQKLLQSYAYLTVVIIYILILGSIGFCICGLIAGIIYARKIPRKDEDYVINYVHINPNGIVLKYFDGHKKEIPYKEFINGKLTIKVGFANVLREADYKTMSEFFDNAYEYIQNVMKKSKKPKVYPVIHIIKGSDEDFLQFVIDPEIADIKALLEDWRKNMTEYYKANYPDSLKNEGEKVKI